MNQAPVGAVLVVPAFNEALRWNDDYWFEANSLGGLQWIFVDDGSQDETRHKLERTAARIGAGVIILPRNCGKSEAVRLGLVAALGRPDVGFVGFIDADNAFPPTESGRMLKLFTDRLHADPHLEAVWSSRVALAGRDVRRSLARHYLGRLMATFVFIGEQAAPYDSQSGLKLFRATDELREVVQAPFETRWLFDIEVLARYRHHFGRDLRMWEEPVSQWLEVADSKVTLREVMRIAAESVKTRRMLRSADRERGETR
jgi:glycosyltransferase involved in cell wall biosynthesis